MGADAVGTATTTVRGYIPKIFSAGTGMLNVFTWIILIVIILIGIGISTYVIVKLLRYNKKIEIFEKIGGRWMRTGKDRATEIKWSTAGDTLSKTLKRRKFMPNPKLQIASRTYMIAKTGDDELINFEFEDLDLVRKKAGAKFLFPEVRFARTQIQKGLKERYDAPTLWQKYGVFIMSITYFALIFIFTYLLFGKWIELAGVTNAGVDKTNVVLDKLNELLGKMDNICTGGSGFIQRIFLPIKYVLRFI